ncbi:toprim domain-containing protein [Ferrovum myxofaciens]|uniref:Toprim domain-containing protein n=2 Tax=Ferrovum myxofaciens TaxID=416213 RepID=A0A9E6MYN2_9PROT|nr:toprim domain-containing protein [Ferrovum myxofaciens]QKE37471.1 MAG: toprim domain-containing protein [Ferrovum myxofaciens]QWY75121.1 MAG: toprim domain-containing protein [Ferrovum myxofaciens]QWY77853.1 MAG: toprim domain-containing protein [Ferrovum myxofaciens]
MTPFDAAKAIHLPELVRGMGHKLTPQGASYGSSFCPKCGQGKENSNKVSLFTSNGIWRWKCFSCGSPASSSIDWVAATLEITAKEAVAFINGKSSAPVPSMKWTPGEIPTPELSASEKDKQYEAFAEVMAKVIPGLGCEEAVNYLDKRGIDKKLTREAHRRGLVYSIPEDVGRAKGLLMARAGEALLRKSGCLKPNSEWPGIAFRPIIFPQWKTGGEFRLTRNPRSSSEPKSIRMGRLHTPWFWTGRPEVRSIILVAEGALDGLSVVQMGWKGHVIALPGASAWNDDWFPRISVKYPGFELFVALDNDPAGTSNTRKILEGADKHGIKARRFSPEGFKDWNDALRAGVMI